MATQTQTDVTDPTQLNPELGTSEEFHALLHDIKFHGMGLILDFVPNHMAASSQNRWWQDVLEGRGALGLRAVFRHRLGGRASGMLWQNRPRRSRRFIRNRARKW